MFVTVVESGRKKVLIVCLCEVSMMLPTHERTMIVIPAHGMSDVRDALTDILAEFGKEETSKSLACLHFIIVS